MDPDGDCKFTPDKTALIIEAPGKKEHGPAVAAGVMNYPRLLRDVEGDFTMEVRVGGEFRPAAPGSIPGESPGVQAGLVVSAGDHAYARLERTAQANPSTVSHQVKCEMMGERNLGSGAGIGDSPTTYLRLRRGGDRIFASFSQDGVRWANMPGQDMKMPAKMKVGLWFNSTSAARFKASFDDFRLTGDGVKPAPDAQPAK